MVACIDATIIDQAQSGNAQAQERIVLYCRENLASYAGKKYGGRLQQADIDDMVSSAMLHIIEHYDEALTKDNPISWLIRRGQCQMKEYITCDMHLVGTNWYQRQQFVQEHEIMSIDQPVLHAGEYVSLTEVLPDRATTIDDTRDYTALYDALNQLSPTRRTLVKRFYGIGLNGATPIESMARSKRKRHLIAQQIYEAKRVLAKKLRNDAGLEVAL